MSDDGFAKRLEFNGFDYIYCDRNHHCVKWSKGSSRLFRIFAMIVRCNGQPDNMEEAKQLLEQIPMEQDVDYQALYNQYSAAVKCFVFNHCHECTTKWENNYQMNLPAIDDHNDYAREMANLCKAQFCQSTRHLFPEDMPIHYGYEYKDRLEATLTFCQTIKDGFVAIEYWEDDKLNIFFHMEGKDQRPGVEFIVQRLDVDQLFLAQ